MNKNTRENLINILGMLLNPYSTIIILLIGAMVTLLATGTDLPEYIKWFVDNKFLLTIFIISWAIVACIYPIVKVKENKIVLLKEQLKEKNNQLEQNSGVILNKYGELAKFNKKSRFYEALKFFVDNNISVDSAQLYSHSSKIDKNKLIIKVEDEEGYAYEGVDINTILQSYHTINEKDYKSLREIVCLRKRYSEIKDKLEYSQNEIKILYNNYMRKNIFLAKKLITKLNTIQNINDIKEENFSEYRIISILVSFLSDKQESKLFQYNKILQNEQVEDYLKESKRTGILGAILTEDIFIFKHTRNNLKNGRMYICAYIEIYAQKYILLFTVKTPELNDEMRWNLEMEYLINDFVKKLSYYN